MGHSENLWALKVFNERGMLFLDHFVLLGMTWETKKIYLGNSQDFYDKCIFKWVPLSITIC